MQILNIAGYKFIELSGLPELRAELFQCCESQAIKGTILLSPEGINISLAGKPDAVSAFKSRMAMDTRFADIRFHHTYSEFVPFNRLKVKLKKEIITMRQGDVAPLHVERAPHVSPAELKKWLDEKRSLTLLDTRNDYEYDCGTFDEAVNLNLSNFGELAEAVKGMDKEQPVVMFCTGGIRCEKAAIYMQNEGFKQVYQLDGGILGYFAQVGGAHYKGDCFVFDDRVALTPQLTIAQS